MNRQLPFVSVIIPTYNRYIHLKDCVNSFLKLMYPADRYEIIICDNNSTDATKDVADSVGKLSAVPIIYYLEKRQGLHFARNSAAKIAGGDILYFTDDDVIADPMMLDEIVKIFDIDPKIGCATGKILPSFATPPPKWVRRYLINSLLSLTETNKHEVLMVSQNDMVFGCHEAIKRTVFSRSGGFKPEITGKICLGDGETGLNSKIRDMGYYFAYTAKSIIYHKMTTERMTLNYIVNRFGNMAYCNSYTDYRLHRRKDLIVRRMFRRNTTGVIERFAKTIVKIILGRESWHFLPAYLLYFHNRNRYDLKLLRDEGFRRMVEIDDWLAIDDDDPAIRYFTERQKSADLEF
jgi:glucosyl-dolichyl phosphate glucuronosyltransferase